jgi:uncharacterized protein
MNLHPLLVQAPAKMLRNIQSWLEKAKTHAAERKFDADTLLQARLAPDQFPLVRQVQSACDSAKGNAARLAGRDIPSHPDTETTIDELRARIDTCVSFLETLPPEAFAGGLERKITMSWMKGKHAVGADFVRDFAIANFHFHVTHVYAILRHNGVQLGKLDFIGSLPLHDS